MAITHPYAGIVRIRFKGFAHHCASQTNGHPLVTNPLSNSGRSMSTGCSVVAAVLRRGSFSPRMDSPRELGLKRQESGLRNRDDALETEEQSQTNAPGHRFTRPVGVWIDPPKWRKATAWARLRPSFLIVGAQRSGTTSLYRYLCAHPNVLPALRKEIHYYDFQFAKGISWYRAHFPRWRGLRSQAITGEASPYYMVHPLAPGRVHAHDPRLKIIAILRDPAERAYSQYHHERAQGHEQLSFEEAIDAETERLAGCDARLRAGPHYYCQNHHRFSYLDRGRYGHYLEKWLEYFPAKQVLVLAAEALFANPNRVANETFAFLGLARHELGGANAHNQMRYPTMPTATKTRLRHHFDGDRKLLEAVLRKTQGRGASPAEAP